MARCWCSPGRARARPPRSWRASSTGSSGAARTPSGCSILTFSRKAAGELRERVTGRLRRTTRTPLALTFHSYAYALLRREAVLAGERPPRLLTGPEQLLEVRRLLHGELEDGALRVARGPARAAEDPRIRRGTARLPVPRGRARPGRRADPGAGQAPRPGGLGRGRPLLPALPGPLRPGPRARAGLLRADQGGGRPAHRSRRAPAGARRARRGVRGRIPGHRPGAGVPAASSWPATAGTWSRWVTRTSRSTGSVARTCAAS